MNRPLCFVLMPFGKKPDAAGLMIDFDALYRELIAPAIKEAGLDPIRADEEQAGGAPCGASLDHRSHFLLRRCKASV